MEHEEAILGKEVDETGNVLVQESPPKLNLRRLESIQRVLQYASVLVLFVFIALIAVSYFQLNKLYDKKAETEKQIELKNGEITEKDKELEDKQDRINDTSDKLDRLQKEYLARKEAFDSLKLNEEQKKAVEQKIENNLAQGDNSKQAPGWIYIQIANKNQMKQATDMARQLNNKGFIVPGIENVGNKAPDTSELRTCGKKNDKLTTDDLKEITGALKSFQITLDVPKFLSNCGKVNSRQYELWLGNNFSEIIKIQPN